MHTSFSYTTKAELAAISIKNACCRRSLLFGLLFAATVDGDEIEVSFSHDRVSELFSALIKETLGKGTEIQEKKVLGRDTYLHRFSSKRARSYVDALDGKEQVNFVHLANFKCAGCRQSFLRGIFLGVGTVTDPTKTFHAELLLGAGVRVEKLDEFLALCGIPARRIDRRGRIGLYYKNSTAIEEFFAEMGTNGVVFELMNVKIEKEIRNQENRATNCVARNISRSVDATAKQVNAIEKLREHGMLESLPEDLRTTAELRIRFDEASLAELASCHIPPISKSGLNHRLARLVELAEKIK